MLSCRYYWHCSTNDSEPEHNLCPNDEQGRPMMFSPIREGCDFLEKAQCEERPICDECNQHCSYKLHDGLDCGHDLGNYLKFSTNESTVSRWI